LTNQIHHAQSKAGDSFYFPLSVRKKKKDKIFELTIDARPIKNQIAWWTVKKGKRGK
tara:strand:+ start:1075 stop:1245 length:171 start_codon:yes stop_codon:yes gene_type:complete